MKHSYLLVLIVFCSCATIVGHTKSSIALDSSPLGAKVEVLDRRGQTKFVGVTPTTASLPNGDGYFTKARYTVKMSKDGFEPSISQMTPDLNGWYFGNILFGSLGLIGFLIVDPISGAMFEFDTGSIHSNLAASPNQPTTTSDSTLPAASSQNDVSIADKLEEIKLLKDKGILNTNEYEAKKKELLNRM